MSTDRALVRPSARSRLLHLGLVHTTLHTTWPLRALASGRHQRDDVPHVGADLVGTHRRIMELHALGRVPGDLARNDVGHLNLAAEVLERPTHGARGEMLR